MKHQRRFTRKGLQCSCGATTWSVRHIISYELHALFERVSR